MDATPNTRLLLVEGPDESHVITNLLDRHRLHPPFEIAPKGGFDALRASIYNEVNAPGRRMLGILADGNDSPDRRWQSISDELGQAECQVPGAPSE